MESERNAQLALSLAVNRTTGSVTTVYVREEMIKVAEGFYEWLQRKSGNLPTVPLGK